MTTNTESTSPTPVTAEATKTAAAPRKRKPAAKAKAKARKPAKAKAKAKPAKKAKAKANGTVSRSKWDDAAKIKVVGEHTRREGSAYYKAYEAMKKIHFDGMHYRRDIGHQAVRAAR